MICSFECTFCRACAEGVLAGRCPNCAAISVRVRSAPAGLLASKSPINKRIPRPRLRRRLILHHRGTARSAVEGVLRCRARFKKS